MPKRIFDTSHLIYHWHRHPRTNVLSETDAKSWAQRLIDLHDSNAIVTPVYVEFVAGATRREELTRFQAYLGEFAVLDGGQIMRKDWQEAQRLAQRVPRSGRRRELGDCLIRALANRLNCEVLALDTGFPS